MKNKRIALPILACVVLGMMYLSSCGSAPASNEFESYDPNPFPQTDDIPGCVISASAPVYDAGGKRIAGKGKHALYTSPHWKRNVTVKANDGKVYEGSLSLGTRAECVSVDSKGIATITRLTKELRGFQTNY